MIFAFFALELPEPSDQLYVVLSCRAAIWASVLLNTIAIGVIQAMLVYRVWHLFGSSSRVQWSIVVAFACSIFFSILFTVIAMADLEILPATDARRVPGSPGCRAARPPMYWRIYLPSLILHTILYILTAHRALRNRQILKHAPVLKRLLRDGGLFFFVVFVSVGFTSIGAFLRDEIQINIVVFFSNYLLATTSIAMSRIMFSLHSLASHLGSDTGYLLSHVEIGRMNWRRGSREGEIIVERWNPDTESLHEQERSESRLQESRIGYYDMPWEPVHKHRRLGSSDVDV
ncbi:hypothetical protein V5O48_003554 [Marasmius crinis-equi]|uniref:Integral membrane protein n=1 Tax=Marasmius crinis-equi TaxID=585013 RepID=A0ABR3FSM9_9AGAR